MRIRTGLMVLVAGMLVSAAQATILIDDFTSGFNGSIGSVDLYYNTVSPNSLGGFRYVAHEFLANPLNRPIWTEVNQATPGFLFIEAGSGVNGFAVIGWGGSTIAPSSGFGGLNHTQFNGLSPSLDLSGEAGISVNYVNNDQSNTNIGLQVIDTSGNVSVVIPGAVAAGNGSAFISFANLMGPVNLSSVKVLALIVEMPTGNDITLTNVEAVPEPATMVALGLGFAALARRKRKA